MIKAFAVVFSSVWVCVEMQQGDGAVLFGHGAQDGVGDEVIATEAERQDVCVEDTRDRLYSQCYQR